VPLLQRNLAASASHIAATLELRPADRCLNIMPLFHIHGLVAGLLATMEAGGSVFCTPGFNALRFFGWLEENGPALAGGDARLRAQAVRRSVEMKTGIVERDETEAGERALLNLGHTFGHALEAATGYSDRLLHGEAVAVGLVLAFDLSARLGLCPQEAPGRIAAHLRAMGMVAAPRQIPGPLPDADELIALMLQDKKTRHGRLRFVLGRDIGESFVADEVPLDTLRTVLSDALAGR